jgi:multidrug efflux pump subunit AcrB
LCRGGGGRGPGGARPAGGPPAASPRGPSGWLETGYLAALRWSLAHRWVVVAISLAVVAANF